MVSHDDRDDSAARRPAVRYSATVRSGTRAQALKAVADLDLDRLPDVRGKIRVLLSPADIQPLLERGLELQLHAVLPVAPLDASFVMSDERAQAWLEKQLKGVRRKGGA